MTIQLPLVQYNPKVVIAEVVADGEYEIDLLATNKYIFSISKTPNVNVTFVANLNNGGVLESTNINTNISKGIPIIFKEKIFLKISNLEIGGKVILEGKIF
jgi:hypothetical protein